MVRASFKVQISFNAVVFGGKLITVTWTDVSADVFAEDGIRLRRGISGASPTDRIAAPGTLEFALDNSTGNSGAKLGYYSPSHANLRAGFGYGVPCRLIATYSAVDYVLFTGRIRSITPIAGQYRSRRVHVTAQDCLADLADAQLTDIPIGIGRVESALFTDIMTATPAAVQPVTIQFGGTDTYAYAFDDLGPSAPVLSALSKVVFSGWAKVYADVLNQLTYRSRGNLASPASQHTFSDSELMDLVAADSLGTVFNRVRVTAHPRHIDAAATTVLYAENSPIFMAAGGPAVEIWGTYRDPNNTLKLVGGTDIQPFTASTDVIANTQADGLGADVTAFIDGTGTVGYSSTVKFVIQNNYTGGPLYLTTLQIRGKGIYEDAPVTVESYLADTTLGDQTIAIDMPYQDDVNVAQDLADYTRGSWLATRVQSFTINPQASNALMLQALQREICDVVVLDETVTGLVDAYCVIHSIELTVEKGNLASVTYGTFPFRGQQAWVLDDPTYSVLDYTTIPAYAA